MAMNGMQIYRLLPRTNCKECGYPTCLVFATLVAEGAKDLNSCPHLGKN
jgi:acetyl-CoA decarbonylase/synthase complex subunit gamma